MHLVSLITYSINRIRNLMFTVLSFLFKHEEPILYFNPKVGSCVKITNPYGILDIEMSYDSKDMLKLLCFLIEEKVEWKLIPGEILNLDIDIAIPFEDNDETYVSMLTLWEMGIEYDGCGDLSYNDCINTYIIRVK